MTDADALSELVRVGLRNPARVVVKVQAKKIGLGGTHGPIEERRIPAKEAEYVDLLKVRKIPILQKPKFIENNGTVSPAANKASDEDPDDPEVEDLLQTIRKFVSKDRTYHDLGVKAFVSFVKAYSKHEASYVFRIKDLDLVGIAKSFGLLRLPGMFELKDIDKEAWNDAEIDWAIYAYRDQAQESKRLIAITTEKEKNKAAAAERAKERAKKKKANASWSEVANKKEQRVKRKEKKVAKQKWLRANKQETAETSTGGTSTKRPRDEESDDASDEDDDDWDELAREERMAKKVKKGEITQKVFDAEFTDL
ncbi:hypothetical protein EST38_g630 [Candolleomyces aberdarensis]|uniref:ATP-dependent rRNA helicase SPB4-like C-terminal extension domain-containing protein n=1 Tax=Candolleomyces aberdarensis TaxID=2316362 RepID=A0A4Q2DYD8_9AGAR|nr:hypothetical protein EST38_g630 [Candolleomyces aberdarensis]